MIRFADRPRFLIVMLCVAVVALRISGLHLHLCMDGSEPPLAVHVSDSGVHHLDEADTAGAHDDRDFRLVSEVVVKKLFGDLDLTLLAAFCALLLFLLARPRALTPFAPAHVVADSARAHLRPPLRGPPA